MARIKKAVKAFLWCLCAVPVMAALLAIAVMTDYMEYTVSKQYFE